MLVLKIVLGVIAVFFAKIARSMYEEGETEKTNCASFFSAIVFVAYAVLFIIQWNVFSIPFIFFEATIVSFVVFETGNDVGFPTYFAAAITIIAFVIAFMLRAQ